MSDRKKNKKGDKADQKAKKTKEKEKKKQKKEDAQFVISRKDDDKETSVTKDDKDSDEESPAVDKENSSKKKGEAEDDKDKDAGEWQSKKKSGSKHSKKNQGEDKKEVVIGKKGDEGIHHASSSSDKGSSKTAKGKSILKRDPIKLEYKGDKLTGEQVEMYKAAYLLIDSNGDGLLTGAKELGAMMRTVGANPSHATVTALLGDRETINFGEFCEVMVENNEKEAKEEGIKMICDAFIHVFDKDRTGKISVTELKHVMSSMGEVLEEHEEAAMLKEAEIFMDSNGMVEYTDFLKAMLV